MAKKSSGKNPSRKRPYELAPKWKPASTAGHYALAPHLKEALRPRQPAESVTQGREITEYDAQVARDSLAHAELLRKGREKIEALRRQSLRDAETAVRAAPRVNLLNEKTEDAFRSKKPEHLIAEWTNRVTRIPVDVRANFFGSMQMPSSFEDAERVPLKFARLLTLSRFSTAPGSVFKLVPPTPAAKVVLDHDSKRKVIFVHGFALPLSKGEAARNPGLEQHVIPIKDAHVPFIRDALQKKYPRAEYYIYTNTSTHHIAGGRDIRSKQTLSKYFEKVRELERKRA